MQQYDTWSARIADTRREARAVRDAAKAYEEPKASLQRLKAQPDPVGAVFERLAQQQKQPDNARAFGMLSSDRYDKHWVSLNHFSECSLRGGANNKGLLYC